ncbi:MAG: uridine kinase [Terriglobia bacterium]
MAIAGPSCAGKTELSNALAQKLGASVLVLDSYYHDLTALAPPERARVNFDSPDALDHELLIEQVKCLSRGETIQRPVYGFATHTRNPHGEAFAATSVLIVEGIFALYWPELRQLFNTKIFVDSSDEVCLCRRKLRDVAERGRTPESVIAQFQETVQPMAARHVRPTSAYADLVLSGEQPLSRSVERAIAHVCGNLPAEPISRASAARKRGGSNSYSSEFHGRQR